VLLQKQTPQVTPDQRGLETSTLTDQESCLNDYEHRPHLSHFKILLTPCQIGALFWILLPWYYRHWITDASQSYIHYLYRNMHTLIDADTYDFGNVFRFHLLGLITLYCFTTKFLKIYLCTNIVVLANVVVIISTMSKIWLYQLIGSILIVVVGCPKAKRLCIMHAYLFTRHKRKESRISNKETKFADDNWYGWQLIWIKHMFAK
jgi:hypothetical protein